MLQPLHSRVLDLPGIRHGFFTRQGGVSEGIYASLNCGLGSADARDAVLRNRGLVAAVLGVAPGHLLTAQQAHTAEAVLVAAPWTGALPRADAIVTATPGLAVAALAADCAPVLFAAPDAGIVAAAHAGWRGALGGILEATVGAMQALGAEPDAIVAVVGPCIGAESYAVGDEFRAAFLAENARYEAFFTAAGGLRFDLAGFVAERLEAMGLADVACMGLSTYADETRFFSYRRAQHHGEPDYGRQISAISLG